MNAIVAGPLHTLLYPPVLDYSLPVTYETLLTSSECTLRAGLPMFILSSLPSFPFLLKLASAATVARTSPLLGWSLLYLLPPLDLTLMRPTTFCSWKARFGSVRPAAYSPRTGHGAWGSADR